MNPREMIKQDFGVDLPIKGGTGNSKDNPVAIERTAINDYVGTEYAYLKYIGLGRGVEWETLGQEMIISDDKKIEKIKIEIKQMTETGVINRIESYYFDITECFGDGKE